MCYAEAGYPSLPDLVKDKQQKFLKKTFAQRSQLPDDPLILALSIVRNTNTPTSKRINELLRGEIVNVMKGTHDTISQSNSSRCVVYKEINPDFRVHDIYQKKTHMIN